MKKIKIKVYAKKIKNKKIDNFKNDILKFIDENNTSTLYDIKLYIYKTHKLNISVSTIYRFCICNKYTYKKGTKYYKESNKDKVKEFSDKIKNECPKPDGDVFQINKISKELNLFVSDHV